MVKVQQRKINQENLLRIQVAIYNSSLFNKLLVMICCGLYVFSVYGSEKTTDKQQIADWSEKLTTAKSIFVKRRAVRHLTKYGIQAVIPLQKAVKNHDYMVRATAIKALCQIKDYNKLSLLSAKISDPEAIVRLQVVKELGKLEPRCKNIDKMLNKMRSDSSAVVREAANNALWPFFRNNVTIKKRFDYDHTVTLVKEINLPLDGWKFQLDNTQAGHLNGWHKVNYDDSRWKKISIGKSWEKFGYDYDGVAWYRTKFKLPPKPKQIAAELHFGAVDEDAWVWLNGVYIGQHVMGAAGWDEPFNLDVSKEVKWNQENQIIVRVYDNIYAGGIWKPITIQIFK